MTERKSKPRVKKSKKHKRGLKRCPSCKCNTLGLDGHCPCGWGNKVTVDLSCIDEAMMQECVAVTIGTLATLRRRKENDTG